MWDPSPHFGNTLTLQILNFQPAISLEAQLAMFREYKKKLEGLVGEERAKFIIDNSLYLVVAGSNDIANTFYLARIRQVQYNINTYTDFMVQSASAFVKVHSKLIKIRLKL